MIDSDYIRLALTLAERGRQTTRPNPMVGAVVVRDGQILGRGYHAEPGGPHAEVAAIEDAGGCVRGSTVYVTLEPCCVQGRTPACTDLLIDRGVTRVVCCHADPDTRVSGEGFARLREAGVEVEVGVLEDVAEALNEVYLAHRRTGRPFVTLKLAQSIDGSIATRQGDSRWITGRLARTRGHQMRAEAQAVMVGVATVLADDPALTVRHVDGADPLRVVVDSQLQTPPDAACLPAMIVTTSEDTEASRRLEAAGAEVVQVGADDTGRPSVSALMEYLGARDVIHVLVEGGSRLAASCLKAGAVDRVAMFAAPRVLGSGVPSIDDLGIQTVDAGVELAGVRTEWLGDDLLYTALVRPAREERRDRCLRVS